MSPRKGNRRWLREHHEDAYVKEARRRGYRSRAAFKLLEIDDRDRLLDPGAVVVDLGAAPGGWSQVAAERVGPQGYVLAVDILPMDPLTGVERVQGDFTSDTGLGAVEERLGARAADVVLSDMAPGLSGVKVADQARSSGLAELALEFACAHLRGDGALLVKIFQGPDVQELRARMGGRFRSVASRKPGASRSRSAELYLLARGFKV